MSEERYTHVRYNDRAYNACVMELHPKGQWVRHSDYQALEAERDEWKKLAYDALLRVRNDNGQLSELWKRFLALKGGGDELGKLSVSVPWRLRRYDS